MNEPATATASGIALSSGPAARTPLHHWHTTHGARLVERAGWMVPSVYTSVVSETGAARSRLALADISAFPKAAFHGSGVPQLTQELLGRGASLQPRGVALFAADNPTLACRLADDHLLLFATDINLLALPQRFAECLPAHAVVQNDVTTAYAGIALLGPHADDLLRQVTHFDCSQRALPVGSCAETALAGVHALLLRPPELALPSILIYVAWDLAEYVWERLLEAGRDYDIAPLGLDGWHSLILATPTARA
jgi:heterotetrameric sarcosine oxidase gamma subunit